MTGSMRSEWHDFADKIDLLGLNAYVAPADGGAHDDYIVAMGYIQNECPTRDTLDYEYNFVVPDKKQKNEIAEIDRRNTDKGIAVVILAIITATMAIFSIYCCLKNRGSICKTRDENGSVDTNELPVHQEDISVAEAGIPRVPTAEHDYDNEGGKNRE